MRILVTGAAGFLGSYICRRLIRNGHTVTAFLRASSDPTALNNLPIDCATGDITDADAVMRAIKNHEGVIHAAANLTYWRGVRAIQDRVNIDGTRNVVEACQQNKVHRLVHISSVAAIGIPSDANSPANEKFEFNLESSRLNYHLSKRRAEEIVLRAVANGLNAVIVNPSTPFGPFGSHYRGGEMIDKVRRSRFAAYFHGGISIAHIVDVVDGVVAAMRQGTSGQRYILAGENVTYRQIVQVAAQQLGVKRSFVPVPPWVTGLASAIEEPISAITGKRPHITYDTHYCSNRFQFYDSSKARTELGYAPRTFLKIVKEYLAR